jgi:hypothetical protein
LWWASRPDGGHVGFGGVSEDGRLTIHQSLTTSIGTSDLFLFTNLRFPTRIRKLVAALIAFAAVELFEAFDGFGVMANTYDPIDFLVNPIGIALGFWLDTKLGTVRTDEARKNPS